jgi:nucleotide-binding universal stress UspA family protein
LVPTDGSKYSRSAVEQALGVANQSNAEVTVLTVIDTTKVTSTLRDLAPSPQASSAVISSDAVIGEASAMAKKMGVKVNTEVRTGDPASIINELSGNYDLIIMGTRGLHGLPHLLLGSVAEKVARESKCTVMVVKDGHLVDSRTLPGISRSKTPLKGDD